MAETRDTQVLEDVVESTEIENPRTTEEAILAKIIAGEEVNINARTRYQAYLKELSSISGGNPNYVETITGTVANPWGDTDPLALLTALADGNATVFMEIDASVLGISYPVRPQASNTAALHGDSFWFAAIMTLGETSSTAVLIEYLDNGVLNFIKALINGQYNELSQYASILPTTLTIIRHPLPEDNT